MKKRAFRTYSYRGIELDKLLDKSEKELMELFPARMRRKMIRGLSQKQRSFIERLRKAKAAANADLGEKPAPVRTHLRNLVILPEMVGSIVGIHNGKDFTNVEIRAEMIGHYLGEFSITYKPVRHNRPGIGATHSSRFIPLR